MNSFPKDFNSKSDFIQLKEKYIIKKLRNEIYEHYIENGENQYFDFTMSKYNITDDMKKKLNKELEKIGFKTKFLFNETAILIYLDEEKVKIWLENDTLTELKQN